MLLESKRESTRVVRESKLMKVFGLTAEIQRPI